MSKAVFEEWKDVKGYEGIYKISNTGKVFSVERIEIIKENDREYKRVIGGKEIKIKKDKFGYMYVGLHKNGKRKMFKIHRLVAEAFVENPSNKKYVNHIDEDKTNNNYQNLEWVDFKFNIDYSNSRIVARVSEVGKIEKVYNAVNEVKEDGYSPSTVTHILNKTRKLKTHKNKKWIEIPKEISKWENVF